ncbi:hypothetical protein [Streptomyces sp. FH025]|uniref:hypothetical protein n=1 Tax=Streptomyces sp. FH025 TaxID=2815937 RepID=UPI001A9D97CA|nr:hypothetical protein [Streptomyces sp. FH025]MBO1414465.1 hypothetical protein [Streptomyces sp. FH025]
MALDVADLFKRLGKPAPPTGTPEWERANAALEDAFWVIAAQGHPGWSPERHPPVIRTLALAVADRRFRNPEGYVQEQAGEVSYRMPDGTPIGLALTRGEVALIERTAGRSGLRSVQARREVASRGLRTGYPFPDPEDSGGAA